MISEDRVKRLGLLVPSSDITLEKEFCEYLPPQIELHVTRMRLGQVTPKSLTRMAEDSTKALKLLVDAEPHLIVYGCTSGSFLGGIGYDEKIERRITKATGIKSVTVSHAVVDTLRTLNARKISVCTPYIDEINQIEKEFLIKCGFAVESIHGMRITNDIDIGKLSAKQVYDYAIKYNDTRADTMFISCTNLKTLEIIPKLRKELAKPIVSSNLAALWVVCKHLSGSLDSHLFDGLRN